jgi:DNA replication protein DnaC
MQMYDNIRTDEAKALQNRRKEIETRLPEVLTLETSIAKLCLELSINCLKSSKDNEQKSFEDLRQNITSLRMKKAELLVASGYTQDYLELHYKCPKCKDTGYIGSNKCVCYKHKLVSIYHKNSDLSSLLQIHNFENFSFDYFSSRRSGDEPNSPKVNMEKIVSTSMSFIKNFYSSNENLLFFGNSGTGKTFLSHCIAKELLDSGTFVLYRTAEELIKGLRSIRYENNTALEDLFLESDLLIIDDLGTEQINEFSKTELFNLLNKRLLKQKKMLISTNYSLKELVSIYSERISSRLLGNFTLCKFYGEDIRVALNLKSKK